jgi:DNA-binding XRE family transcriptional regulator
MAKMTATIGETEYVLVPRQLWEALTAKAPVNLGEVDPSEMDAEDWDDLALSILADATDDGIRWPLEVVKMIDEEGRHPIAAWRRYRNLTQAELAAKVGRNATYISQIETGREQPSRALLAKLRDVLETGSIDSLLPGA